MVLQKTNRILFLTYGLPALVLVVSVAIALSPLLQLHPELATALTYDLTLTAPLLFLLLSRKNKVSKLKAVPFFIGGTIIATYLLPESGQQHLNFIKTYALPLVELLVFIVLARSIYRGIQTFKSNAAETADFYAVSKKSAEKMFGKSRFASFFASEITMLYHAFFGWKKRKLRSNEFTNYKENASFALAGALLMVVCIETYAFHVLLTKWSSIAAWILTATSIYTAFMIIGHIKALIKRPSILTDKKLILKNGLIADIAIPLNEIEKIEANSKEMESDHLKIGNLGISKESTNHNIAIYFKTPQTIEKLYGFTDKCDVLLIHIDFKTTFLEKVHTALAETIID